MKTSKLSTDQQTLLRKSGINPKGLALASGGPANPEQRIVNTKKSSKAAAQLADGTISDELRAALEAEGIDVEAFMKWHAAKSDEGEESEPVGKASRGGFAMTQEHAQLLSKAGISPQAFLSWAAKQRRR